MRQSSYTLKFPNFKVINILRHNFNATKAIRLKIFDF
jgi:hypothetical protein